MRSNRTRLSRFFVEGALAVGDSTGFDDGDCRKMLKVLRLTDGDEIEVIDSGGRVFRAELRTSPPHVAAVIREEIDVPPIEGLRITVAQSVPHGQKMDFVVEKLTELGVARIVPMFSRRSARDVSAMKLERWRRLAKSASQQCGRRDVPAIADPCTLDDLTRTFGAFDRVLMPYEAEHPAPLRDALSPLLAGVGRLLVAIGPEGGFSSDEVEDARRAGATTISLGRRILRTETAGLYAVIAASVLAEAP